MCLTQGVGKRMKMCSQTVLFLHDAIEQLKTYDLDQQLAALPELFHVTLLGPSQHMGAAHPCARKPVPCCLNPPPCASHSFACAPSSGAMEAAFQMAHFPMRADARVVFNYLLLRERLASRCEGRAEKPLPVSIEDLEKKMADARAAIIANVAKESDNRVLRTVARARQTDVAELRRAPVDAAEGALGAGMTMSCLHSASCRDLHLAFASFVRSRGKRLCLRRGRRNRR
jgi:hypothetical protein